MVVGELTVLVISPNDPDVTLPFGVRAKLHVADSVRLSILESSVTAMAPQAAGKS